MPKQSSYRNRQGGILPFQIDLNLMYTMFPSLENYQNTGADLDLLENRFNLQHDTAGNLKDSSVVDYMIGNRTLPAGSANGVFTGNLTAVLANLARPSTELIAGLAKLATQAITNAGADDSTMVTPKKLKAVMNQFGMFGNPKDISGADLNSLNPMLGFCRGNNLLHAPNGSAITWHILNLATSAGVGGTQFALSSNPAGAVGETHQIWVRHQDDSTWENTWTKVWTQDTDGHLSNLDADMLDNMQPSSLEVATTVVSRDADGNFQGGLLRAGTASFKAGVAALRYIGRTIRLDTTSATEYDILDFTNAFPTINHNGTVKTFVTRDNIAVANGLSINGTTGAISIALANQATAAGTVRLSAIQSNTQPLDLASGVLSIQTGNTTRLGVVKVTAGNGLGIHATDGTISMALATTAAAGSVSVSTGLSVTAAGALSVKYGSVAGTACVGNDTRLSNARTPTRHVWEGTTDTYGWATDTSFGHVNVPTQNGLSVTNGSISIGLASKSALGVMKLPDSSETYGLSLTDGVLSIGVATSTSFGVIKVTSTSAATGLALSNGILQINEASTDTRGTIKIGTGVKMVNSALNVKYGSAAGTACEGSDTRLSNARTPVSHAWGGSTDTYGWATTSNYGHVRVVSDNGLNLTNGSISIALGSSGGVGTVGLASVGTNGLKISTYGLISMNLATTTAPGTVSVSTGLSVTAAGALSVKYGSAAGTACEGSDTRLSNARTPVSHASTATTYGVGTTTNYGHVKVTNSNGLSISSGTIAMATGGAGTTGAVGLASSGTNGLGITDGLISMGLATSSAAGSVIVGTGLGVNSGKISVSYGTTTGTACEGSDTRLSNARTPVSHASTATTYGVGTTTNYGHVKVTNSNGLSISSGTIAMALATSSAAGTVIIGNGISVDGTGKISIALANAGTTAGIVKLNATNPGLSLTDGNLKLLISPTNANGLSIDSTGLKMSLASLTTYGVVKIASESFNLPRPSSGEIGDTGSSNALVSNYLHAHPEQIPTAMSISISASNIEVNINPSNDPISYQDDNCVRIVMTANILIVASYHINSPHYSYLSVWKRHNLSSPTFTKMWQTGFSTGPSPKFKCGCKLTHNRFLLIANCQIYLYEIDYASGVLTLIGSQALSVETNKYNMYNVSLDYVPGNHSSSLNYAVLTYHKLGETVQQTLLIEPSSVSPYFAFSNQVGHTINQSTTEPGLVTCTVNRPSFFYQSPSISFPDLLVMKRKSGSFRIWKRFGMAFAYVGTRDSANFGEYTFVSRGGTNAFADPNNEVLSIVELSTSGIYAVLVRNNSSNISSIYFIKLIYAKNSEETDGRFYFIGSTSIGSQIYANGARLVMLSPNELAVFMSTGVVLLYNIIYNRTPLGWQYATEKSLVGDFDPRPLWVL